MKKTSAVVNLNEVGKAQKFVSEMMKLEGDVDLVRGKYVVNAKSIMGLFSLDLSIPVIVEFHSDDAEEIKRFCDLMTEFQ